MIDFRSDTCTAPTAAMLRAMVDAKFGNEGYGDDSVVNELEAKAALTFKKEAAVFLPSGTMGNLISILSHVCRGEEIITDIDAHIVTNECGGICAVAGAIPKTLLSKKGVMSLPDVKKAIKSSGSVKTPRTGLICIENTHNKSSGSVLPMEYIEAICNLAHENYIPVHMDGARIFNASIASGRPVCEIVRYVDSITFCLSKGLGCPAGAVLLGKSEFIKKARFYKKMLGGVMRQTGIIAAAGIIALDEMVDRLKADHLNAKLLASGLSRMDKIIIEISDIQTNIVYFRIKLTEDACVKVVENLKMKYGILVDYKGDGTVRMVTHKDISKDDVEYTLLKLEAEIQCASGDNNDSNHAV